MLRRGQALSCQGTGHQRSFCSKHGLYGAPSHLPRPSLAAEQCWPSAPTTCNLRRWDKPSACPMLCSWRAGSCSPGSPELPPMQLQAPPHSRAGITGAEAGSASPPAPAPPQRCPQTPGHFSPEPRQVAHPACASARTEQAAMGCRCLLPCRLLLCMAGTTSQAKQCQGGRTGVQAARALLSL